MSDDTTTITRSPEEPGDLMGAREVADLLGVPTSRLARFRDQGKLPAPWSKLAATPVWLRSEIEDFAASR